MSKKSKHRNDIQIGIHTVAVQSCWVTKDGRIFANIGIDNGGEYAGAYHIRYEHVDIPEFNGRVKYRYADDDREFITREWYDGFFNKNITSIRALVMRLMTADDTKRLRSKHQLGLGI